MSSRETTAQTWKVIAGDTITGMATLPEASVHACITSPPYWGLRDYGHAGQIGLEETPEEHIARLIEVFREVRRVLRDDGTLWVNYGDAYSAGGRGGNPGNNTSTLQGTTESQLQSKKARGSALPAGLHAGSVAAGAQSRAWSGPPPGYKPKDLLGLPWMLAFALRADGWYLRQDIIWHKPNPMPESVTDRCTKAHEYLFLLSKSARYHFDAEAIAEASVDPESLSGRKPRNPDKFVGQHGSETRSGFANVTPGRIYETRNRRSVWTIPTQPFPGAHFAVFPEALVEPCVKAGCPLGGTVLDPFNGSGTTGVVALKQGRSYVGCELNPEYVAMSRRRLADVAPLLAQEVA